jgi:hypothetical protein
MKNDHPAQDSDAHGPAAQGGASQMAPPRWRHDRILFEVEERGAMLACSVSKAAIQDACGRYSNLPRDIMAEFVRLRDRIEKVAIAKFHERPEGSDALIHVWSADLDEDPEPPAEASQASLQR